MPAITSACLVYDDTQNRASPSSRVYIYYWQGPHASRDRRGTVGSALLRDRRLGLGTRLGAALVAAVLPADRLADAFARAATGGDKVVVTHPGGAW